MKTPASQFATLALLALLLSGCYAFGPPDDEATLDRTGYMAERRPMPSETTDRSAAGRWNAARCTASPAVASSDAGPGEAQVRLPAAVAPLSAGDMVKIVLPGDDAPTGTYKVSQGGTLDLEGIGTLDVRGRTAAEAEADLSRRLVARNRFKPGFARASLKLLDRAAVQVLVSGAVFEPGRVTINVHDINHADPLREAAAGDSAPGLALSAALSSAAGVRPDADLTRVALVRAGRRTTIDVSGFMTGAPVEDAILVNGDRVEVPSRGCFQPALARPSPITPPGVRTFISNLVTPAGNNAGAAINHDSTNFPYGTRLLQAAIGANCVGGTRFVNADRYVVLVSVNPLTGESEAIERRLEALMRRRDRAGFDPVILPNDAIACYDSTTTNIRDLVSTLTQAVISASIGKL